VRSTVLFTSLATLPLVACGGTLGGRVERTMAGCIAARNPAFLEGDPTAALAVPLPPVVDTLARRIAPKYALPVYQAHAAAATTQAELTCALELGAFYVDPETVGWLTPYARHPDAAVATLARRLLAVQDTAPPTRPR
jgi:hypothetical protein